MNVAPYFELRAAVLETFYETLMAERYSVGQAAGRCLVEFRRETAGGGRDALVALSVLLARVARHDPAALARFQPQIDAMQSVARRNACWRGLAGLAKERLQEDLRFILERERKFRGASSSQQP